MHWFYILIAGLLEVGWAVGLKYTEGFSRLWPSVFTLAGMAASMFFLALAVQRIPLGTSYAVWTGIGAVGTVILGILLFDESVNAVRIGCIVLIVAGIAGLRMTSG